MKKSSDFIKYLTEGLNDMMRICIDEFKRIFGDRGVVLIFFVAGLAYPLLYNGLYKNEVVYELPVAVVDLSQSAESREFIKR